MDKATAIIVLDAGGKVRQKGWAKGYHIFKRPEAFHKYVPHPYAAGDDGRTVYLYDGGEPPYNNDDWEIYNETDPEIPGMNTEDLKQILPLLKAAQRLGIGLQIKTCSDEDFRLMTKEEAERVGEAIKANISIAIKLSTQS